MIQAYTMRIPTSALELLENESEIADEAKWMYEKRGSERWVGCGNMKP